MNISDAAGKIKNAVKPSSSGAMLLLAVLSIYTRLEYFYTVFHSEAGLPKTHDSFWYLDHANELIQNFKIDNDFNGIFYIGYYGILAAVLFLFNSDTAMVLLQVFVNALSVLLVFRISEILFNRRVAFIAGMIYVFSYELKFWSVYLLTDSLFVFAVIYAVYLFLMYAETARKTYACLFFANLAYMVFLRPAGVVTAAFFILYMLLGLDYGKPARFLAKRPVLCLAALAVLLPVSVFVVSKALYSPLGMSFYWNLRWLLYGNYSNGQVFDIPTLYDHKFNAVKSTDFFNNFFISFFVNNWYHIILLYGKRLISFWGGLWIWHYRFQTPAEAVRYFIKLAPLLIMLAGMLRVLFRRASGKALLLFVPVVSSVLFCVVFFIDNGWRYRLPSLPFAGIFIAYGLDIGFEFVCKAFGKTDIPRRVASVLKK